MKMAVGERNNYNTKHREELNMCGLYDPKTNTFFNYFNPDVSLLNTREEYCGFSNVSMTNFKSKEDANKTKDRLVKQVKEIKAEYDRRFRNNDSSKDAKYIIDNKINNLLDKFKRLKPVEFKFEQGRFIKDDKKAKTVF